MATPNVKKFSCLCVLLTSSVLVPTVVYQLYISEIVPFHGHDFQKVHHDYAKLEDVKRRYFWEEQEKRKLTVLEQCSMYQFDDVEINVLPSRTLSSIIVDDEHQVLYCQIPKVACTNWRRIFLIMSGKVNVTNPLEILSDDAHHKYKDKLHYLSQYTMDQVHFRLKHYFKFMIAREPLERILSAYRNKFMMEYSSSFHKLFGRKIIKRYRQNATKEAKETGDDVKFPEFVKYLLDPRTVNEKPLNEHWIQQYKHCYPCTFNYDVIGHHESLSSDAHHILHYMKVSKNISFPSRSSSYSHSKTSDSLMKYFKQIPIASLKKLYEMYNLDYAIFGYPYPAFLEILNVSQRQPPETVSRNG